MKITGKCKEDFDKWMLINNKDLLKLSDPHIYYSEVVDMVQLFKHLTESMQYGVYVDFFDSVDIKITMNAYDSFWYYIVCKSKYIGDELNTRAKARTQAIEKANEIYNK